MNALSTTEMLARNRYVIDESEPHIVVDQEKVRATGTAERLIAVCPAGVYSKTPDGDIAVEYAACLECGTCLAIAPEGILSWRYPNGGFGVQFRDG